MSTAPSEVLMPAAKKVKKPKAAALKQPDELVNLAHECENLTCEAAFEALPSLLESVDSNYIKLGGILAVIRDNEWWKEGDYITFKEFLEKKFGLQYRKGAYLIATYENLINSGVEWEQVKELGWSKLRVVSSVLTKDNAAEWVAKAKNLTVLQLYDVVKDYKAQTLEATGGVSPEEIEAKTTTLSFKLHADQKETIKQALDKARKEASTEYDAVALEAICINYLAGANVTTKKTAKPKAIKLTDLLSQHTYEEVLAAFEQVWPNIDVQVTV